MAALAPPVPPAVVSFLSALLPRGFAVGPSLLCEGRPGLWWVGRSLEAGALLGGEGDEEWPWEPRAADPMTHGREEGEVRMNSRPETGQTDSTREEKVLTETLLQKAAWISFACQAPRRAQQNVQRAGGGGREDVRLRVSAPVRPGTELLLYDADAPVEDADKKSEEKNDVVTDNVSTTRETGERDDKREEEEEEEEEERRIGRTHPIRRRGRRRRVGGIPSEASVDRGAADDITAAAAGDTGGASGQTDSRGLPVRCSSRLAAKPRRVHRPAGRAKGRSRSPVGGARPVPDRAEKPRPDGEAEAPEARERRYRCSICGKKFFQLGHLKKHQFSHTEEKPFSCQECGKNYTSAESFRAHQMSHRGERPFACPHCDKSYGLRRDLKEHMVLHTGEKPYACEHCGKAFARRPSLRIHRLLHCGGRSRAQPPKVPCALCPKLLANVGSLRNHMRVHTGEKPHVCQHCGKRFSQKGNLDCHLRIHSGEKPFPCSQCDHSFSQKPELRRHMLSHTGGGFLCSYCGKSLRDQHSLRSHERLHTGERPHRCPHCGKGYTLATKLRRHIKSSHLMEKPYACHCGASYTVRQSLLRHQAQHRTEGGRGEEGEEEEEEEEEGRGGGEGRNGGDRDAAREPVTLTHPKPIRGRPKKNPHPAGAEEREGGGAKRRRGRGRGRGEETSREGGDAPGDVRHAVVYVRAADPPAPLLLAAQGSGRELVEVVISEGATEQCIVVHGQEAVGELLILQEEEGEEGAGGGGLCSVAQTVEIDTA